MATLPELLKTTVELGASDLHLSIDTPPQVRVHGELRRLEFPPLTPTDSKALAYSVLTDAQKKRFEETLELDFSFGIRGAGPLPLQHVQPAGRRRPRPTARFPRRFAASTSSHLPSVHRRRWRTSRAAWSWSPARPAAASRRRWRR